MISHNRCRQPHYAVPEDSHEQLSGLGLYCRKHRPYRLMLSPPPVHRPLTDSVDEPSTSPPIDSPVQVREAIAPPESHSAMAGIPAIDHLDGVVAEGEAFATMGNDWLAGSTRCRVDIGIRALSAGTDGHGIGLTRSR